MRISLRPWPTGFTSRFFAQVREPEPQRESRETGASPPAPGDIEFATPNSLP
jgi:hypothetical protein